MTPRRYTMAAASAVASQAAADIENYLWTQPSTLMVQNVEDNPAYQVRDIDLLWTRILPDQSTRVYKIEVKGDRYYHTNNYFFETISNASKNTPGCFMYTEADFVFYYFVKEKELHVLPMPATRDWFKNNLTKFRESKTSTPVRNNEAYITVGRLVSRAAVKSAIPEVKIIPIGV